MYDIVLIFEKIRGKHTGIRQYVKAISSEGYMQMQIHYAQRRGYEYIGFIDIEYAEGVTLYSRIQQI